MGQPSGKDVAPHRLGSIIMGRSVHDRRKFIRREIGRNERRGNDKLAEYYRGLLKELERHVELHKKSQPASERECNRVCKQRGWPLMYYVEGR